MNRSDLERALEYLGAGNWKDAHEIVQKDEASALACWAHGIVHIMEGDLANARYWYRAAGRPFPEAPSAPGEIEALRKEIGKEIGA